MDSYEFLCIHVDSTSLNLTRSCTIFHGKKFDLLISSVGENALFIDNKKMCVMWVWLANQGM